MNLENLKDIDIVQRILDGEKNLYRFLVERYQNQIFSFMIRFTGSRTCAEELTQESFMKAYASLKKFNTQKKFFPWLYTIALNQARDWNRKNKATYGEPVSFSDEIRNIDIEFDQERFVAKSENIDLIKKALSSLTPEYRETLVLRYRYDLSIKEISKIFNISLSGAKMRIHRGLNQLKQVIYKREKIN